MRICKALASMLLWPGLAWAQLPQNVPDFCVGSPDTVKAGQVMTLSGTQSRGCIRVETGGKLVLTSGLKLTVDMIFGRPGSSLEGGTATSPLTSVEIIGRDGPLDTAFDPEQFGRGLVWFGSVRLHGVPKTAFVKVGNEPLAGQTTISTEATSGWQPGDRVVIPGTKQPYAVSPLAEAEVRTIASVTANSVTLTAPLSFDHRGPRDVANVLRDLPRIGNLTRSIVIRSENPNGTRWHAIFIDRADVDIRYVDLRDMGRTLTSDIDSFDSHMGHIGTNQIGRYTLHLHHVFGPTTPQTNGRQFTLIGNVAESTRKWGFVVHNASYGLLQDNIVYDGQGAGIVTEMGTETGNDITHNFIVKVNGAPQDPRCDNRNRGERGHCGSGFFLTEPSSLVEDNVVANAVGWCQEYMMIEVGEDVLIPAGPGQVPSVHANRKAEPLRGHRRNTCFASSNGLTIWDLNAFCCYLVYDAGVSTIEDLFYWHIGDTLHYSYGENKVTFLRTVFLEDPNGIAGNRPLCFYFGDYISPNIIVKDPDVQNCGVGFLTPIKLGDIRDMYGPTAFRTSLVDGGKWANKTNIWVSTPYGVTGGYEYITPRRTIVRNATFLTPNAFTMSFENDIGNHPNFLVGDEVIWEQGTQSSRVYYSAQAPGFVLPDTPLAPVGGLTNQQAWAQQQKAVGNEVAKCTTTRADINSGFVCGNVVSNPDADGDGVPDANDKCPGTAPGTVVNASGCPVALDSDHDGVTDTADKCPNTAAGTPVDGTGCPLAAPQTATLTFVGKTGTSDDRVSPAPPPAGLVKDNVPDGIFTVAFSSPVAITSVVLQASNGATGTWDTMGTNWPVGVSLTQTSELKNGSNGAVSTAATNAVVLFNAEGGANRFPTGAQYTATFNGTITATVTIGSTPPPPTQGAPTTSDITLLEGPTTTPGGQTLWKFQSKEGPSGTWQTALWGTDTHRFNVTVIPGSGPLPVYLWLHSAGVNGYQEPREEFNPAYGPGIFVMPVDLAYMNGVTDPVTGQGRFYSKWQGYADSAGVFQPITSDRITRYVQWALTQTQRWTPDPNRVYAFGASLGSGGLTVALRNPNVYTGVLAGAFMVDDDSFGAGATGCTPTTHWRTATGPPCKNLLDAVWLVQNPQGTRKAPAYLTWNKADNVLPPTRDLELLAAMEAQNHGYQAEWVTNPADPHSSWTTAGNLWLQQRLDIPTTVTTASGNPTSDAAGSRTNLGSGPPPPPVDTTAPTVTLTVPPSPLKATVTLTATCADNIGCVSAQLVIDGTAGQTDTTAPYSFALDTTTLSNASHTFSLVGLDAAGNTGLLTTPEVRTVDNSTPPPPGQTTVIQTPNSCKLSLVNSAPTSETGWTAVIRNMVTGSNIGTSDKMANAQGLYEPFVNSLTQGQTYQLAMRWTRSGSTVVTYPTQSVTVSCGK